MWDRQKVREILLNFTMLQSGSGVSNVDGVYWTLWSELRFYLLFMAVVVTGLALYLMYRFGQDLLLWGILGLAWLMGQLELGHRIDTVERVSSWHASVVLFTVFLMVMAAIALGATDRVRWKWLTTAGAMTYPFYLMHYLAGTTVIAHYRDTMDPRLLVVSVISGFLALSWLVHRLVERPVALLLKNGLDTSFARLRNTVNAP